MLRTLQVSVFLLDSNTLVSVFETSGGFVAIRPCISGNNTSWDSTLAPPPPPMLMLVVSTVRATKACAQQQQRWISHAVCLLYMLCVRSSLTQPPFLPAGTPVTRPLLQQLRQPGTLARDAADASYLLCLLLDALVDSAFPVVVRAALH